MSKVHLIENRIAYLQKNVTFPDDIEIISWDEYNPQLYDRESKVVIYDAPHGTEKHQAKVNNLPHYALDDIADINSKDFEQFVNAMGFIDFE